MKELVILSRGLYIDSNFLPPSIVGKLNIDKVLILQRKIRLTDANKRIGALNGIYDCISEKINLHIVVWSMTYNGKDEFSYRE